MKISLFYVISSVRVVPLLSKNKKKKKEGMLFVQLSNLTFEAFETFEFQNF